MLGVRMGVNLLPVVRSKSKRCLINPPAIWSLGCLGCLLSGLAGLGVVVRFLHFLTPTRRNLCRFATVLDYETIGKVV